MTEPTTPLSRADFPEVSDLRFFQVSHNPKSVSTPVTLQLREYESERAKAQQLVSMSRLIGVAYTTAVREELLEAARKLHYRVGGIDDVVGVY